MPSGRVHLKIELSLAVGLGIGGGIIWREGLISSSMLGLFLLSYLFSSFFLSPDLDLWESRATRRWGIGRILWYPYSKVFRHRRISHHLFLGPLTRISYLGVIVLLLLWGWSTATGRGVHPFSLSKEGIISILSGLYLPNQEHILVDRLWSAFRRWKLRR